MNRGQELFYRFFMERAQEGKEEEAKALLADSFAKQAEGTFNLAYLQEVMPKFFAIVKPEALKEAEEAMRHFALQLGASGE